MTHEVVATVRASILILLLALLLPCFTGGILPENTTIDSIREMVQ